jgi:hypothetical protein
MDLSIFLIVVIRAKEHIHVSYEKEYICWSNGFFPTSSIFFLLQLGFRMRYTKIWWRPWVEMGTMLSSSFLDELIIKCIWPLILKITPILTRLKVLCNLRATNKAWKTLVDSSNYDWDSFIWDPWRWILINKLWRNRRSKVLEVIHQKMNFMTVMTH